MKTIFVIAAVIAAIAFVGTGAAEVNAFTAHIDSTLMTESNVHSMTTQEGSTYIVTIDDNSPVAYTAYKQAAIISGYSARNNPNVDTVKLIFNGETYTYNDTDDIQAFINNYGYPDGTVRETLKVPTLPAVQHLNGSAFWYGPVQSFNDNTGDVYQNLYDGPNGNFVAKVVSHAVNDSAKELYKYEKEWVAVQHNTQNNFVYFTLNMYDDNGNTKGVNILYALNNTAIASVQIENNSAYTDFVVTQFTNESTTGFIA